MADKIVSGEEFQAMSRKPVKPGHEVALSSRTVGMVVVVIVLCGLSFLGGTVYGKHHAGANRPSTGAFGRGGGYIGGFRNGGGFGQVTAISSTSITVQNPRSGTSKTFAITGSTTITDNGQPVTTSDIQSGEIVIVQVAGAGSTTATSILVNPGSGGGTTSGGGAGGSGTVIQ